MEENNQNTTENKKCNVPKNNGNFKEKGKVSFGKGVLIPFCSGVIGAALVVGTCFGIPTIRNNILGLTSKSKDTTVQSVGTR